MWGYIRREHLYGTHTDLTHLTPEELRPIALSYLKPKRMPHVLGTEQEAVRLAERYGADVTKARIAALLHDCTKKLDMDEQLALCRHYGIPLDELEQKALKLLHSKTAPPSHGMCLPWTTMCIARFCTTPPASRI